jgi:hypothetical protein
MNGIAPTLSDFMLAWRHCLHGLGTMNPGIRIRAPGESNILSIARSISDVV